MMDLFGYAFPVPLMVIFCNIMWFYSQYFWSPFLGSIPEKNSKFSSSGPTNLRDNDMTMVKTLPAYSYDEIRPKQMTITTLSPQ